MPDEFGDLTGAPSRWAAALRSAVLPLGIIAVILGGLWYWDARGDSQSASDAYGVVELPVDKNPTDRSPAPEVGRAGPDFLLERPEGGTLRLSDLQGQPVILNFWATWCAPCRAEMPELVAAYAQFRDEGLIIVAVNLQETNGQVLDFAEEFGIDFPIVVDRDGELKDVWRLGGPVDGIPTSYFLDETGVVQDLFLGPLTEDGLTERIESLLRGPN